MVKLDRAAIFYSKILDSWQASGEPLGAGGY